MSAHHDRPANQPPAIKVEVRLLDPGNQGDQNHVPLFIWQIRDGHGQLLASGEVAGAPNTPELAGWRYHAFTDAAQAAITALKDLEAATWPRACDFCAAAPAAWRYPVQRDRLATVLVGELLVIVPGGDWYACPACHLLAEAAQWDALSKRARLPSDQGSALWASFRARLTGPAVALGYPEDPPDPGTREPGR
jgi:hypothetical protein